MTFLSNSYDWLAATFVNPILVGKVGSIISGDESEISNVNVTDVYTYMDDTTNHSIQVGHT